MEYKYKIGDTCVINTSRANSATVEEGQIVTITHLRRLTETEASYMVSTEDQTSWAINQKYLDPYFKFKVGDTVQPRFTLNKYVPKGAKGIVTELRGNTHVRVDYGPKHMGKWYTRISMLEPVKPEEQEYTVDGSFIKEAHKAACSEWKRKLENKFPDLFKQQPTIQELIAEFGGPLVYREGSDDLVQQQVKENAIYMNLPNNNYSWSKTVLDWSIRFCEFTKGKGINAYPVHNESRRFIIRIEEDHIKLV